MAGHARRYTDQAERQLDEIRNCGSGLRWPKVAIDEVCTKNRVQETAIRYFGFVLGKGICDCKTPSSERVARIVHQFTCYRPGILFSLNFGRFKVCEQNHTMIVTFVTTLPQNGKYLDFFPR